MHKNNILPVNEKTFTTAITFSDNEIFSEEAHKIDNSDNFSQYNDDFKLIFKDCIFNEQITINTTKKTFTFINCNIKHCQQPSNNTKVRFEDCSFEKVDSPVNLIGGTITNLTLCGKTIKEKFYINSESTKDTIITYLTLSKIIFEKKFKLYNCTIENAIIEKLDFNDDADFKDTKFIGNTDILFTGIQFHKLALFADITFNPKILFQKATFHNEGSFVGSTFNRGIILKDITIKKTLNFANISGLEDESVRKGMSRETFRIIKHNFKKLNNRIDHNLFHAYELEAKYNEIINNVPSFIDNCLTKPINCKNYLKYLPEKIIYVVHKKTSFFGTSWILPLKYIFYVALFTAIVFHIQTYDLHDYKFFYQKIDLNLIYAALKSVIHNIFKFMSIVYFDETMKKFFEVNPLMFIIHKGALGYLYYQFLTAVRKDTKK